MKIKIVLVLVFILELFGGRAGAQVTNYVPYISNFGSNASNNPALTATTNGFGYTFTVASNITVTALGYFCPSNPIIPGLQGTTITICLSTNMEATVPDAYSNSAIITTAKVTVGAPGTWTYSPIAPITLNSASATAVYYIYDYGDADQAIPDGLAGWENTAIVINYPVEVISNVEAEVLLEGGNVGDTLGLFYSTPPLWTVPLTNYWTLPGDSVNFQAVGRNMATTNAMAGIEIMLDTNVLYMTTNTAGNGLAWTLDGRIYWDGTNVYCFSEYNAMCPRFLTLTNEIPGTNTFQINATGSTNGIILLSASITAERAPQGATAPPGTTTTGPGSTSFTTGN